jgi:hypothetical protein
VRLATYLINRLPTRKITTSPFEAWTGDTPDLSNLHIFGSKGQVLVEGKHLAKFDKRTVEMIYLGPALTSHGHRMWNPNTSSIIETRNVRFIEEDDNKFMSVTLPEFSILELENQQNIPPPAIHNDDKDENAPIDISMIMLPPASPANLQDEDDPAENDENNDPIDLNNTTEDNTEQQQHNPPPPPPALPTRKSSRPKIHNTQLRDYATGFLATGTPDKPTFEEALRSNEWPMWKLAIQLELDSLNSLGTWKLVDAPQEHK